MTVKELIEILRKCDPDAPVRVEKRAYSMGSSATGMYEDGFDIVDICTVSDLETRVIITPD